MRTVSLLFLFTLRTALAFCDENCQLCSNNANSSTCLACKPLFYLTQGACYKCSPDCLNCLTFNYCTSCVYSEFLVNGHCLPCSNGCITCSTENNCSRCSSGFYKKNGQCHACNSQCGSCDETGCLNCQYWFYKNSTAQDCLFCGEYCRNCHDEFGCTNCIESFYIEKGNCTKCSTHCKQCKNSTFCNSCHSGYHHKNGECLSCGLCNQPDVCIKTEVCLPFPENIPPSNSSTIPTSEPNSNSLSIIAYILVPLAVSLAFFYVCLFVFKENIPEFSQKTQKPIQRTKFQTPNTFTTDQERKPQSSREIMEAQQNKGFITFSNRLKKNQSQDISLFMN